jgi:5,10-methylenetetrahydromethanopterin reductase
MGIRLGMGLHWPTGTYHDLVTVIDELEVLGYDQIWVSNEKFFRDMYVTMTVAAEHTARPQIGAFVADPYSHHPALTAMAMATLDVVSGGRAVLGLGAGGTGFPAMGIERRRPAVAIKEAIQVIRALWAGETVDFQGQVVQCHGGRLNCLPERPHIPIVVASRGHHVLQVGGEMADGVMIATYAEPEGIRHALARIEAGARRAGRRLDDIILISRVDACIAEDRRAAMEAVKPMVGVFLWTSYPDREFVRRVGLEVPPQLERLIARRDYNLMAANAHLIPDAFVEKFCWAGTVQEVTQKVAEVVKLGITHITFLPHPPAGGTITDTMRAFARTVKPALEALLVT